MDGKYLIIVKPYAKKDIKAFKLSGKKKRCTKRLKNTFRTPENSYTGTGKPEALKYDLEGYWSRRIIKKNSI